MELKNSELENKMSVLSPNPLQEVGLPALDLALNKAVNKVPMISCAISWLFNQNISLEKRIELLEAKTTKLDAEKADKEAVDQRFDDLNAGIDQRFEALTSEMNERFGKIENKLEESVETTMRRMGEVEVSTHWRIQDCEELLRSRTSEKYVTDALKELEERLRREVCSPLIELTQSPLVCYVSRVVFLDCLKGD